MEEKIYVEKKSLSFIYVCSLYLMTVLPVCHKESITDDANKSHTKSSRESEKVVSFITTIIITKEY